jgi:myo-inositol-1(or 4)-monophosphatase
MRVVDVSKYSYYFLSQSSEIVRLLAEIRTSMNTSNYTTQSMSRDDARLLTQVVAAVRSAGRAVQKRFNTDTRPADRHDIRTMIADSDAVSLGILREALSAARPTARWDEDESGAGPLPPGEWWVVDPVEGAINHIHGLTDWGVTATLVRDNAPWLTAVHLPMSGDTYTAVRGSGAWIGGDRLHVSKKSELSAAMVGTAQATPGESRATHRRIGMSATAMLEAALVVRVSVPSTLQLLQVAAGRQDLFWQHSHVRAGLLAGALLVAEAGGSVTDLNGMPWSPNSSDFLASAPTLTAAAVTVLSPVARHAVSSQEQP